LLKPFAGRVFVSSHRLLYLSFCSAFTGSRLVTQIFRLKLVIISRTSSETCQHVVYGHVSQVSQLVFGPSSRGRTNNQTATSATTTTFITSLAVNLAAGGIQLVVWIFLRRFIKALYEPRTYIPPRARQVPVLGRHLLWPIWKIIWCKSSLDPCLRPRSRVRANVVASPEEVLRKNGVDPYVFIRFLFMLVKAFVPIWLVSWLVLFPINSVNTSVREKEGLDRFTYGNIAPNKQSRLWAHLILDYVFICESALVTGAEISLDHLPHMARDGALACCPSAMAGLASSFETAPSEYGSHHWYPSRLYGGKEARGII
jgi:hypothetical protein